MGRKKGIKKEVFKKEKICFREKVKNSAYFLKFYNLFYFYYPFYTGYFLYLHIKCFPFSMSLHPIPPSPASVSVLPHPPSYTCLSILALPYIGASDTLRLKGLSSTDVQQGHPLHICGHFCVLLHVYSLVDGPVLGNSRGLAC
jgi:cellulose synthase/poly-beta-1,6-N-acetylglucosamine synthase-like glycosyltransferase